MKSGRWKLTFEGVDELQEGDRQHISELIVDGFDEGEIIQYTDEDVEEDMDIPDDEILDDMDRVE